MNRKRSQLQAYFAGIFDGEGHINIGHFGNTYKGYLGIQMNDPLAIGLLLKEYPEGVLRSGINQSGSRFFTLRYNHYNAYNLARDLEPFLFVKWEQMKVFTSFLAHRRREHAQQHGTSATCTRCEWCKNKLLELREKNKRVKTVELLTRHGMRQYRAKPEEVEQDQNFINSELKILLEGVETRLSSATNNKIISALEQDIVQTRGV